MLDHWLRSLSDDYLLAWSNRGLMRRAGKLVEALDPGAVALEDGSARGTIEGHRQTLEGVGFDHARCSCPATGQCHHLVAFLVALRALAGTGDAVPGDAEPADAGDAEPQAAIEPYWRSESDEALVRALGRAHVRRAERWLADDVAMQWEEAQGELRARIDDDAAGGQSTVRMPALGGLGASVCSCKAPTCAHRALAVLVVRRHLGLGAPALGPVLEARQLEALGLARRWLLDLAARGLSGLAPLDVDRGEAIATELRQADLPRPAGILARGVADCARLVDGAAAAHPRALLAPLAELWAVLSALETTSPPRPLTELAGTHRARYRPAPALRLLTLGPELWETRTGFRGYSVHFVDREAGRFVSYSEARRAGQDTGWDPRAALSSGTLANRAIADLGDAEFTVEGAALSDEGRLGVRERTRVLDASRPGAAAVIAAARTVETVRQRLAAALDASPIAIPAAQPALVRCRLAAPPRYDPLLERWVAEALDEAGEVLAVDVQAQPAERRLAARHTGVRALFGRARLDGIAIRLEPVIAFTETAYVPLGAESIVRG